MSSVEKRVRNGRTRWYARFRTPDGAQQTKTFARKVDADRFLVDVESSKLRGAFVDARRASLTVGEWADDWLAAQADLAPRPGTGTPASSASMCGHGGDAYGWLM
jgi:hypothetical protein